MKYLQMSDYPRTLALWAVQSHGPYVRGLYWILGSTLSTFRLVFLCRGAALCVVGCWQDPWPRPRSQ